MHLSLLLDIQVITVGKLGFSSQTLGHPEVGSRKGPQTGKYYLLSFHSRFSLIKDDKQYQDDEKLEGANNFRA